MEISFQFVTFSKSYARKQQWMFFFWTQCINMLGMYSCVCFSLVLFKHCFAVVISVEATWFWFLYLTFSLAFKVRHLTLYAHSKTAQKLTIIQQYRDWYTGRWWVGCYSWYSEEGTGRGPSLPRPLLAVPNVTAQPSTASVPTSYYLMWHYNCLWTLEG